MIVNYPFRHYKPAPYRARRERWRARLEDVWEAAVAWALRNGHKVDPYYGIVTQDGEAFAPL